MLVTTRYMVLASLAAALLLVVLRLTLTDGPFGETKWVVTAFCITAAFLVLVRHQSNLRRLLAGTEHRL